MNVKNCTALRFAISSRSCEFVKQSSVFIVYQNNQQVRHEGLNLKDNNSQKVNKWPQEWGWNLINLPTNQPQRISFYRMQGPRSS